MEHDMYSSSVKHGLLVFPKLNEHLQPHLQSSRLPLLGKVLATLISQGLSMVGSAALDSKCLQMDL